MRKYIYNRVSSVAQDYLQQQECIRQYFERNGMDLRSVEDTVVEKVSGTIKYEDRELSALIDRCEAGDVIYVSELSRLGRSMSNLFALVDRCCRLGITLIQCKDGAVIENDSISGKAILFAMGLAAEIEVSNIRQRTKMALAARLEESAKNGFWISKAGNVCTRIGSERGCDTSVMRQAAAEKKSADKKAWMESSPAFKFARRKIAEGWTYEKIATELNAMDDDNPGMYRSRTGARITAGLLRRWKMCMGIPLPTKIIRDEDNRRKRDEYRKRLDRIQEIQEAASV